MGFRQNNKRKAAQDAAFAAWKERNRERIVVSGLPAAVLATRDDWAYFVRYGYHDHGNWNTPPGTWIDYQSGARYSGGWQKIAAGKIPEVILVRDGTVIPQIALAQSTQQMDWSKISLHVFAKDATTATGQIFLPGDASLNELTLTKGPNGFQLSTDPSGGKVQWQIQ